jgi:hypothetical protein
MLAGKRKGKYHFGPPVLGPPTLPVPVYRKYRLLAGKIPFMLPLVVMPKQTEQTPTTIKEMAAMGGRARAKKLSKKRRREIARDGANARWKKEENQA